MGCLDGNRFYLATNANGADSDDEREGWSTAAVLLGQNDRQIEMRSYLRTQSRAGGWVDKLCISLSFRAREPFVCPVLSTDKARYIQ